LPVGNLRQHPGNVAAVAEIAKAMPKDITLGMLRVMWDIRKMRHSREQDKLTLQLSFALMCGGGSTNITRVQDTKLSADDLSALFS
jgi:hypothetical protein